MNGTESGPDNRGKTSLLRSAAKGAGLLAIATTPGTCFFLYQWATTGDLSHLGEAAALFFIASYMGACGGAAYHVVAHSRMKSPWKPFLAIVAAVEAYLLAFSLLAVIAGLSAPEADKSVPFKGISFYLFAHGYGLVLCIAAFGFAHAPSLQDRMHLDQRRTPSRIAAF